MRVGKKKVFQETDEELVSVEDFVRPWSKFQNHYIIIFWRLNHIKQVKINYVINYVTTLADFTPSKNNLTDYSRFYADSIHSLDPG